MSLDAGFSARDVNELYFIWESLTVEVYPSDVQSSGHGDGLRQYLTLRAGNIPDILQEVFHPEVQGGDLGVGVPEMVE